MGLEVEETPLAGLLVIRPEVHADDRGFFLESWNSRVFSQTVGADIAFVQDNHSRSARGVLRGLHYQDRHAQGKLVRVARGAVYDAVVDLRADSKTRGEWFGIVLSEDNHLQLWVPPGFAHGFLVLSDSADFLYKVTDHRYAAQERTVLWNDPAIGIAWPLEGRPTLSPRDAAAEPLANHVPWVP